MNEAPVRRYQPRTQLCRMLSILWIFPSAGALLILILGFRNQPQPDGPLIQSVSLEQWIALAVLLAHPIFFILARRLAKTEPFREVNAEEDPEENAG